MAWIPWDAPALFSEGGACPAAPQSAHQCSSLEYTREKPAQSCLALYLVPAWVVLSWQTWGFLCWRLNAFPRKAKKYTLNSASLASTRWPNLASPSGPLPICLHYFCEDFSVYIIPYSPCCIYLLRLGILRCVSQSSPAPRSAACTICPVSCPLCDEDQDLCTRANTIGQSKNI